MWPNARHDASVASRSDGTIFFVGGTDENGNATAVVDMFDPYHEDGWFVGMRLEQPRKKPAVVVYKDRYLYVCGCDYNLKENRFAPKCAETCEVYDIEDKKWSTIPLMVPCASRAAAAVVENTLYIIGGSCRPGTRQTYAYKPDDPEQSWTQLTEIPADADGHHAVAVIKWDIYVCGGSLGSGCYRYDTDNNLWHLLPARLKTEKLMLNAFMATEPRDKRLYIVGGIESAELEVFDGEEWNSINAALPERLPAANITFASIHVDSCITNAATQFRHTITFFSLLAIIFR